MSGFGDYTGASYDVLMTQGDTFVEELLFEGATGDLIDLIGYQFSSQIRRTPEGDVAAQFSIDINLDDSTVTRTLAPEVTSDLSGVYAHDFQWTDPQGRVRTLLSGQFEVEAEVTR